jgi:starch synthase
MISGEVAPYAKTGGLSEVMESLPKAMHRLGHDVRVFMPLYGMIDRQQFAFVPIGKPARLNVAGERSPISFCASILSQEVLIYFLESERYFPIDRPIYDWYAGNLPYYAFNQSVFKLLDTLDWVPDIIHVHDWHASLVPNIIRYLPRKSRYKDIATVQTIHNSAFVAMEYQWDIPAEQQDDGRGPVPGKLKQIRQLNFLRRGLRNADIITTVSEQYSRELLMSPETSHGLSGLLNERRRNFFGVRNGVDYSQWNPMFDPKLPVNYDRDILHRKYDNKRALQHRLNLPIDDKIPMLGMNARITEQKGFSLIFKVIDKLMKQGVQLVIVGSGSEDYSEILRAKMQQYPSQIAFRGTQADNDELGTLVYAGSDIFLMPSLFEPCGLGQMVSLRYGSIPVVRRTGGLADTIFDYNPTNGTGNGFVFDDYTGVALHEAINRALKLWENSERWQKLIRRAMAMSYSWEIPAKKYERLYRAAIKEHRGLPWSLPKKW